MKKLTVLVSLVPTLALAAPSNWSIDASHSQVGFAVKHLVISNVRGEFGAYQGKLFLDEADVTKSTVNATIDVNSLNTKVADRDAHLKSADFLDVAKYPQLSFRSRKVEKAGAGYRVTGDLELHGVKSEVVLDAEFAGTGKDPWGNERAGFSAKASLDRREFGLVWNAALETGGVLVGEKVEIAIELEAIRQAAAPAAAA